MSLQLKQPEEKFHLNTCPSQFDGYPGSLPSLGQENFQPLKKRLRKLAKTDRGFKQWADTAIANFDKELQ
jgi:hypothetical protein